MDDRKGASDDVPTHESWCLIRFGPPEFVFCDCGAEPRLSKEAIEARRAAS